METRADQKYSVEFEDAVASYVTGNPNDRGEAVQIELYTKLGYATSFFESCRSYIDLNGKRFMEVGCGTGYVSVAASRLGATVTLTDFVPKAIELASSRLREHEIHANVFASDLRDTVDPFQVEAYDFVFCFQVLEHIPRQDHGRALRNLFRMVAPGGYLFIDTENSLCPYDRHDTKTWLVRLLSQNVAERLIAQLGRGLNFYEPSKQAYVQVRDYLSYDEIIGAAMASNFSVQNAFMPHGTKAQYLRMVTGSDWLHDALLQHIDVERFSPISILLRREG